MAFDAGSIEATLTLNRNPFTAGLAAAKSQARGFERERFEATVDIDVDTADLVRARAEIEALDRQTINLSTNTRNYGGIAGQAYGGAASHFSRMASLIIATAPVIASGLTASVGAVGALSSAMVIAGAGAGALALVAVPTFKKISDAVAGGTAEIAKLPPGLRQAANGLQELNTEYDKLVKANQFLVAIGLSTWFNAGSAALRTLNPLVNQAAEGFADAGIQAIKFFNGSEWREFVTFLTGTMRPTINLLTEGIFALITSVMNLTEAFWNLGGSNIMRMIVDNLQEFAEWTDRLGQNQTFIRFMESAQRALPIVGAFLREVLELVINLAIGLEPLGSLLLSVFTFLIEQLNKLPPEYVASIGLAFASMWASIALGAGGPVAIAIGTLAGLAVLLSDLYTRNETFRRSVDGMSETLQTRFGPIWDTITNNLETKALPVWERLITLYQDRLEPVVQRLSDQFNSDFWPVLGRIADTITGRLIPAVGEFLIAVEPFTTFMTEQVGRIFIDAITTFGDTFNGALEAITEGLQVWTAVFNGDWEAAWTHLKQMFVDLFVDPVKAIWNELWPGFRTDLAEEGELLRTDWSTFWDSFKTDLEEETAIWQEAWTRFWGGVVTTQDGNIIVVKSAWQTWLDEMGIALDEEVAIWNERWAALWVLFRTDQEREQPVIQTLWDTWLQGMKDRLATWVGEQIVKWAEWWTGAKTTQDTEQPIIRTNWDVFYDTMKAKFDQWSIDLSNGWASFWGGTITQQNDNQVVVQGSWNEFWTGVKARFDLFVQDETAAMRQWWADTVQMFREEGQIIQEVMNGAVDGLARAWDRLRSAMAGPVDWVIENVINRGILDNWNQVMMWIGQPRLTVARLRGTGGGVFNAQGQQTGNPAMGLAEGGPIYGGIPNKDSVNAMLMPGEYVLSKRAVAAMGGLGVVDKMHSAAKATSNAGYAAVPNMPTKTIQSLMSSVPDFDDITGLAKFAYGGVMNHVAAAGAEIERVFGRLPGGIGGKAARANASDHPAGLALDFMTLSNRGLGDRIEDYIYRNAARLSMKYNIWLQRIRYPGGGFRAMADRGSPTANHMDHVHTSFMAKPGMVGTDPGGGGLVAQLVSWWSQVGDRVMGLFNGVNTNVPGGGTLVGPAMSAFSKAIVAKALGALRSKLEALMTTIMVPGGGGGGSAGPGSGPVVDQVRAVANRYGWGSGGEWDALSRLIQKESSWNPNAQNPTSTAYGLFQFLNSTWGSVGATKTSNPGLQAEAGLKYIKGKYGTPSAALNFHNRNNWYDTGGVLRPGVTMAHNGTGRNEYVFTDGQMANLAGHVNGSGDIAAIVAEVVAQLGAAGDTFNVMLPQGATVRELADTIDFRRRVRSKGRYSR